MTPVFVVINTSQFERAYHKLIRHHAALSDYYERAISILERDPYNRTRLHPIKKLKDVRAGDGEYRIRFGHFRFRYDIERQVVYLKTCGMRREGRYR